MKKFGILLIVAVMIAASSLTACGNKNSSSEGSKTESEAMYNLDIALEYRENNSEPAEEVTVTMEKDSVVKVILENDTMNAEIQG
ncbi:MAG: hypothetical protein IKG08_02180 [Eubacterium sp.]|nr:hypothetical protein [Eubacterium sp.]